jgi:hypothetical protein
MAALKLSRRLLRDDIVKAGDRLVRGKRKIATQREAVEALAGTGQDATEATAVLAQLHDEQVRNIVLLDRLMVMAAARRPKARRE